jgi:meiotically up-regulated gene 157 (Mug157) protein
MSFASARPDNRAFHSDAVEATVAKIAGALEHDPELAWIFSNCYPNTLDRAVEHRLVDGRPDTFVVTGDIDAMWLRDSTAQVWPYLGLAAEDPVLANLLRGVINRQTACVLIDPYANAFTRDGQSATPWAGDKTHMVSGVYERKWELDSLCWVIRLAHGYWKATRDVTPFDGSWQAAMEVILDTFLEQQRFDGAGPYRFERDSDRDIDTLVRSGVGPPANPCGLIVSSFRPSDDRCELPYNVPANLMAVAACRQLAEMAEGGLLPAELWSRATSLAIQVRAALEMEGVSRVGLEETWAYECDAMGNYLQADDPKLPSLLALPYLGLWGVDHPRYAATRRWVLGAENPNFAEGAAASGGSSVHQGPDWIWPLSIITQALTSNDDEETRSCLRSLKSTHAGTGLMHESFHKDDPTRFTRQWFGWANSLFGELIVALYRSRPGLLEL